MPYFITDKYKKPHPIKSAVFVFIRLLHSRVSAEQTEYVNTCKAP